MKTRPLSLAALCIAASLAMLLAGCFPPGGTVKHGTLTVSINNSINAKTLLPSISMDAASYTIQGRGPNGATFSQPSSGDPVTVEGLAFGTWTVTVNALNKDGDIIGQGGATATLSPGQDTTLAITVVPLGGNGSLDLKVTWTASLQSPSIQASLLPFRGEAKNLDFTVSSNQASYAGSSITAGYYTLTLQLLENGVAVMGAVEVVRIVSGQTTSGIYDFSKVNMGTIEVNITPQLANPIAVSISGVPSTVGVGTSLTATAAVSDGTTNMVYAWYLNGVSQLGTGPSYTFGSTLSAGYYRLDVMAFTADGMRAGSATASFQVVKTSIPTIVGSWNNWRAWAKYTGVTQFTADGQFTGWEDYAETILDVSGTWSLSGDTFTMVFSHGGPGGSTSFTVTWVNANQGQSSVPGFGTSTVYRKGFEPDGYLFNNPKYPPIALVRDTPAQSSLPSGGLALYQYVAGPNAQNTVMSWTDNAEVWVYVTEQMTVEPGNPIWVSSPHPVALTPGQTYLIVLAHRPFTPGDDVSISVTETPANVGTWINPSYNGNGPQMPGKVVVTVNSAALYVNDTDTTPVAIYPFSPTGDWIDGGAHYFKLSVQVSPPPSPSYRDALMRVSNNNSTMEVNSTDAPNYPVSIDPAGEGYQIYFRQY